MEVVPLDVVGQELGELVRHAVGHDVALQGGRAALGVHCKEVRDVELHEVQDELLGPALLQVAPAGGLQELQQELVVTGILEPARGRRDE